MKILCGLLTLVAVSAAYAHRTPFDTMPTEIKCNSGEGEIKVSQDGNDHFQIQHGGKSFKVMLISKNVVLERFYFQDRGYKIPEPMTPVSEIVFAGLDDKNRFTLNYRKPGDTKVPSSHVEAVIDGKVSRWGTFCN